jgi:hypothetical protein
MDPARLFKHKIQKDEEFSMVFDQSEKNNEPIEVHFSKGQQIEMFDMDTIKMEKNV